MADGALESRTPSSTLGVFLDLLAAADSKRYGLRRRLAGQVFLRCCDRPRRLLCTRPTNMAMQQSSQLCRGLRTSSAGRRRSNSRLSVTRSGRSCSRVPRGRVCALSLGDFESCGVFCWGACDVTCGSRAGRGHMEEYRKLLRHRWPLLGALLTLLVLVAPVRAQDRTKIEIVPMLGYSSGILSVALSPDGGRRCTAGLQATGVVGCGPSPLLSASVGQSDAAALFMRPDSASAPPRASGSYRLAASWNVARNPGCRALRRQAAQRQLPVGETRDGPHPTTPVACKPAMPRARPCAPSHRQSAHLSLRQGLAGDGHGDDASLQCKRYRPTTIASCCQQAMAPTPSV